MSEPEEIEISVWVKRGKMMVRRDALPLTDPDHPSQVLMGMGLQPSDYGYPNPPRINGRVCPCCGYEFGP